MTPKLEILFDSSIQELGKCLSEQIFPCNRASFTQVIPKEDLAADTSPADAPRHHPRVRDF